MAYKRHEERTGMIAVVDDTHFHYIAGNKFMHVPHTARAMGDVFALLEKHDLLTAWVLPECTLSHQTSAFYEHDADAWDILATSELDGTVIAAQGYRRSARWEPSRYVVFPEYHGAWQPDNPLANALDNCTDATELYGALRYMELQLGVPMKQSPGAVGLAMLKKHLPTNAQEPTVPAGFSEQVTNAHDAQWKRALTPDELDAQYIHCIDKNSAYIAACSANMGIGLPEHLSRPTYNAGYADVPCVWHVTALHGSSLFDGMQLPTIATPNTWVWGASMDALRRLGYTVEADEAYVWTRYDALMSQWGADIWNARSALKSNAPGYRNVQAVERAYEEVKVVATRTVGRFNMDATYEKKGTRATDNHPDRFSTIVDTTAIRIMRRMKLLLEQGHAPFMVYTDGLYIVSNERNPRNIPALHLSTSQMLGGYKHAYTVRLSDVKHALNAYPSDFISAMKQHILAESEN